MVTATAPVRPAEATRRPVTHAATVIEALARSLFWLAALGVGAIALITSYDVFMRYVLNSPTAWATEISTYLLVAVTFCGAGETLLRDGHVRVDIVLNRLPADARAAALVAVAWLGLLVAAIMAWQSCLLVLSDYRTGARLFSLLLTPSWMPKLPIAVGLIVLVASMLVEIERLCAPAARRNLPYVIFAGLAVVLAVLGPHPPAVLGTPFDLGSLLVLLCVIAGAWTSGGWRVAGVVALIAAVGCLGIYFSSRWVPDAVIPVLISLILLSLAAGIRITFALTFAGLCSIYFLTPIPFPVTVADRAWNSVNGFELTAVPMYVLMGSLIVRSGLSRELFSVLARVLARLPGGLAHAGIVGCAVFAAVSGSSVATAATIGSVACPEMTDRGYRPRLAYGSIAAGGTLGILIPPSVPLIIYGILVGAPVTQLFMAGILPGILLTLVFMGLIVGWVLIDREAAPAMSHLDEHPLTLSSFVDTGIVVVLIVMVIATLYAGVATPSEVGALGAVFAFIACVLRFRMTPARLKDALAETVVTTSFIFLIVVGANVLTFAFDFLKISQHLMAVVASASLNRWLVLALVLALYIVLGMFLDSISMLVLTLPVVYPLTQQLGFDPIWLGIILVIMAEVGLITPPVGMNLFILQGVGKDIPVRDIALGALPFIAAMMVVIVVLCIFPAIVTLLL